MSDITPTDKQWAAIKQIVQWYSGGKNTEQVFYLAGYAGTGKSTIAKFVVEELSTNHSFLARPAAFTGKAANVLRQKGNPGATTFHGGMYVPYEDEYGNVEFVLAPDAPFSDCDLILGDEVSMINEELGTDAESFGKKILVMGDPGQLPPVSGAGYWTNRRPDVMLTEVMRQALDSPILRIATLLREGRPLPVGEWADKDGNITRVVQFSPQQCHWLYREETQAICGVHRMRWGHTKRIRERRGFEGELPQAGETVICCKNDKQKAIFNGSFGKMLTTARYIRKSGEGNIIFDVKMEDLQNPLRMVRADPYLFQQHIDSTVRKPQKIGKGIQEFDFGYVLTCHKAQGSEWDDVTVLDDSKSFREDQYKWAYTAATRAAKSLTFIKR